MHFSGKKIRFRSDDCHLYFHYFENLGQSLFYKEFFQEGHWNGQDMNSIFLSNTEIPDHTG